MSETESQYPDWLLNQFYDAMPEIPARDYIHWLKMDFNIDSQLIAIQCLLHRNREAEQYSREEIRQAEADARNVNGWRNYVACEEHADLCHASVYLGAAHSMSALGMLAPLIETIFYQSFQGMRTQFFAKNVPANKHPRWTYTGDEIWDCHKVNHGRGWKTNIVEGIFDLSNAVGVGRYWPIDLKLVLTALFAYRNKMFHHGLEWPSDERKAFADRIANDGWGKNWFSRATSGTDPWVFYLTDEFIDHTFTTIEQVLDGLGAFIRDDLLPKRFKT